MNHLRAAILGLGVGLAAVGFACGGDEDASVAADGDAGVDTPDANTSDASAPDAVSDIVDAAPDVTVDLDSGPPPPPGPAVYAHTPTTLYKVDPVAKTITLVGDFSGGCSNVIDLAIDRHSNAVVTTFDGLYHLDLTTAVCSLVSNGAYPNSLSFVPKGTLDPNADALVGYYGGTYTRIDTTSGAITSVGGLSGGFVSSGDIVSVEGGGTFLTVIGAGCNDCLVQVDPVTGGIVQSYGSVNHSNVYGIAFWDGMVYGFAPDKVFAVNWQDGGLSSTDLALSNMPDGGLIFYGAGSTTAAPLGPDGGTSLPLAP